jgi:hypothetical protein
MISVMASRRHHGSFATAGQGVEDVEEARRLTHIGIPGRAMIRVLVIEIGPV